MPTVPTVPTVPIVPIVPIVPHASDHLCDKQVPHTLGPVVRSVLVREMRAPSKGGTCGLAWRVYGFVRYVLVAFQTYRAAHF